MSEPSTTQKAKERNEIPTQYKWRLEDIFATDSDWNAAFDALKNDIPHVKATIESIEKYANDPAKLRDAVLASLKKANDAYQDVGRLYTYAKMRRDEDNRNSLYQGLVQRVESLYADVLPAVAPIHPTLLSLPEETLKEYVSDEAFADFDADLRNTIRDRPHTLGKSEEALIAGTGEVFGAPSTIFDMLSDADMSFPAIIDENGDAVAVTQAKYSTFVESVDRRVRKEAYEAHNGAYKSFGNAITAMYAASVKGDIFMAKTRRYSSSLEASLQPLNIPTSVYSNLIAAVGEHIPSLASVMAAKRKALNLPDLHMYDQYVNVEQGFTIELPYEKAYDLVKEALVPLGEEYQQALTEAFSSGWIDVYENAGKTSGAYSWGTYGVHPYVLLNFDKGLFDDISVIAHEMGHAMHTYYANANQPYAKSQYSLFTAEVASTVNEILLMIHLLEKHKDDRSARRYLIGELLNEFRSTVFRQTMFAEFEKEAHAMAERGEPITLNTLTAMYKGLNEKYYGSEVVIDDVVGYEWLRIPHFYRAFYVYQYATGYSAAVYIARRIIKEGKPAVQDYLSFLKAGASVPPINALRLAGIDMEKKESVSSALDWYDELAKEYAELVG